MDLNYNQASSQLSKAFEDLQLYIRLTRLVAPRTTALNPRWNNIFADRRAAVDVPASLLGNIVVFKNSELFNRTDIVLIPGIPSSGKISFSIWKYSQRGKETFELITFMS